MNIPVLSSLDRWLLRRMEHPRLAGVDFELAFRRSMRVFTGLIMVLLATVAYSGVAPGHGGRTSGGSLAVVDYGDDITLEKTAVLQAVAQPTAPPAISGPRPPGRLVIPRIGVDAAVVAVDIDNEGNMGVPKTSWDTGWYDRGPSPGDAGDAVITGHLDWIDTLQGVFYSLHVLAAGDMITVQRLDGVTHHFKVTSVQVVAYNAHVPGLFDTVGPSRLTLITCGGTYSRALGQYTSRVVVDSTLVD